MVERRDSRPSAQTEATPKLRPAESRETAPTLHEPRGGLPRRPPVSESSGSFNIPDPAERYELGPVLGSGGMGRVVEAFDRQLDRKVALKFLTYPDPNVLEMFQSEARSQARVRHDHVLEVYDIGELKGRPFISMRHLPGKNLEERRAELSLESIVRLLAQTAEGLHAAHREGLLHHDVKPSNVLVEENADGDLVAYISDFGVSSRIEDSSGIAGTPSYLAPERIMGATIDRRSDIYSLGVTMYQMFTGEVPFTGKNPLDLLEKITGTDPRAPRSYRPSLPVELEAVVLRCLAKNPDDRYPSARAVAEDLRRYLDGEVVEAYAATLSYRLTRFALRNKVLVGMAGFALVALLVASVAVAIFAYQAEVARQHADQRREQAEGLIGFMVGDLQGKLKELGRLDVLDDVGDKALEYFRLIPEEEQLTDQELLSRSQMLYQIGEVRVRQGKFSEAEAPMKESLALAKRLSELDPDDPDRLFALGQSHFWVGFVYWQQDAFDEAVEPFENYLDVSKRLSAMDPERLDWILEVAYAHNNLSATHRGRGELSTALLHARQSDQLLQHRPAAAFEDLEWRKNLAESKGKMGRLLRAMGHLSDATDFHLEELDVLGTLATEEPKDLSRKRPLAICHATLSSLFFSQLEHEKAQAHFDQARQLFLLLAENDPENQGLRFNLNQTNLLGGKLAFVEGDLPTAVESWQNVLADVQVTLDEYPKLRHWRKTKGEVAFLLALSHVPTSSTEASSFAQRAVDIGQDVADDEAQIPGWSIQSRLLLANLAPTPQESRRQLLAAETEASKLAQRSKALRHIAVWAESLLRLERAAEAEELISSLQETNYFAIGLEELCRQRGISCLSDTEGAIKR